MDWLNIFLTFYLISLVKAFSINECFRPGTTFCFGAKGNDTSYDPRCGCLGNNDCDVLISGVKRSSGKLNGTDSIKIDWDIKIKRIDLNESQIRRIHFYISKSEPCVTCNMKDYSIFVPLDVIVLDVHRQKTLAQQPLRDNLQITIYVKDKNGIEVVEIRNPEGSFHANDTSLKYEGEGDAKTFVTVSFESNGKLFYDHNSKKIYDVDLQKDEVYPGVVSMVETVSPGTTLPLSVDVSTNVIGTKVKLFDPHRLEKEQKSGKSPWIIALIVALVAIVVIASLCCCYCWKKKRDAKNLNKIHANYN